jgi:hypothetical protein
MKKAVDFFNEINGLHEWWRFREVTPKLVPLLEKA